MSATVWILTSGSDSTVPDFRQATHTSDCFIVAKHREGSWEFTKPRRSWVEVPVEEVPAHVERCHFCGGGRALSG